MARARFLNRVWAAFIGSEDEKPVADPVAEGRRAFREAAGITIDKDEDQWRRLTGAPDRDLTPMTQARMRKLAFYLWQSNVMANRLIELPLAYLLAEGVHLEADDAQVQAWLDAFWNDPINRMERKLPKKVRELGLFGEQCWPVFVNEITGHVRLGYLDPSLIETVVADPDNPEQPIGVVTARDAKGKAWRYRVIVTGPEEIFISRTREIRATFTDGDCFYFPVNELSSGLRGRSDLLAVIDWCDAYEQFLFGEAERGGYMRSFLWDVTLSGATREEVEKRAREIATPRPNSIRVHNDAEKWESITPDLKAVDNAEGARLFRNHILGGSTIPEHWLGGGGDVNRATAGEMGDPTFKVLSMRQATWKAILEEVAAFVIWRRLDPAGKDPFDPSQWPAEWKPRAVFPELATKDIAPFAAALAQVVTAAAVAIDRGLVGEETALAMIAAIAGRLGVTIDIKAELGKARAEVAARRAEQAAQDSFTAMGPDNAAGSMASMQEGAEAPAAYEVGDRVTVKPGAAHDETTKAKAGTVKEIGGPALAIAFDGMAGLHKWYTADELEPAGGDGAAPAAYEVGDRVTVKPGAAHDEMTKAKTGTVKEIGGPALAIAFDGMAGLHKWYTADELEPAGRMKP